MGARPKGLGSTLGVTPQQHKAVIWDDSSCYRRTAAPHSGLMQIPDVSTPARTVAVGIENSIRRDAVETGVLIGADGLILVRRSGGTNSVQFTVAELRRATGATFTHNHPAGFGPSLDDIKLGAQYGLKEVRVVTTDFRYSVSMMTQKHVWLVSQAFPQEEAGAMVAARDDVKRGLLNPRDFSVEVRHRTVQRLASRFGFDYWRQQS